MWRKGRKARTKPQVSNMHGFPQLEGRLISLECTKHNPAASPATPHTFQVFPGQEFLGFQCELNSSPQHTLSNPQCWHTSAQVHDENDLEIGQSMSSVTETRAPSSSPWPRPLHPFHDQPAEAVLCLSHARVQLALEQTRPQENPQQPLQCHSNPCWWQGSLPLYCASKVRLTDSAVIYKYCWAGAVFFRKLPRRNLGEKKERKKEEKNWNIFKKDSVSFCLAHWILALHLWLLHRRSLWMIAAAM